MFQVIRSGKGHRLQDTLQQLLSKSADNDTDDQEVMSTTDASELRSYIANSLKPCTDSETPTNIIDLERMEIKAETPDPDASEMDVDKDELDCYLDDKSAYRQGRMVESEKLDEDSRGKEFPDVIPEWTEEKLEMVENTLRKLDKVAEQYKNNLAPRLEKYHNEKSGKMPVS